MEISLDRQIQQFYDASSGLWEQIWGEHMHHGYYGADGHLVKERRQAQIDLIEELLQWGAVAHPRTILDVGCGIGGSTLYLASKFQAAATGITLSPVQADRGKARNQAAGGTAQFLVANALAMPFADQTFDLVWSLESGEHMPDKTQFLRECHRVLKPGGLLLLATWCHREVQGVKGLPQPLTSEEQRQLQAIYQVYCLPYVVALSEYETIAQELGFQQIRTADWSQAVAPFWDRVIASAISPRAILGLLSCGWPTMRAALSLGLMRRGYRQGLIRYGLLCGTKI